MRGNLVKLISHLLVRLHFWDGIRLFEVFSALNLLAWGVVFWTSPEMLLRDSYTGFSMFSATSWAFIFMGIAALQFAGMVWAGRWEGDLRFVAMAFASGAWTVVAVNFFATGLSTTANANYALMASTSMISGAYLGWKSTFHKF